MSEYRAIYKCRLCGESFVDYVHAKDEDAAAKKVIDFSLVYSGAHVSRLKVRAISSLTVVMTVAMESQIFRA